MFVSTGNNQFIIESQVLNYDWNVCRKYHSMGKRIIMVVTSIVVEFCPYCVDSKAL